MKKFYITTAIDYVNAKPHGGHAYEKIAADVIARWKRMEGYDVHFLTGTDENAQKVDRAAKKAGKETKQFVDEIVENFKELCRVLNISNDDFIRTTEERHVKVAQSIFKKLFDNGDIYKGQYEGLYCVGCESFYLEKELVNGKCPIHDTTAEKIKEESYFFRMSKYQDKILETLQKPGFVLPESKRNEMINRVKEGLKDLSVSRVNLDWGIKVPIDDKHRIYVWVEALINYISALGYPDGDKYKKYWPADIHLIGVDIVWFHSVIFPAILLSAGIEIPKNVFVHGFVNVGGEKLSKTKGIVLDPFEIVKNYSSDALRYFLIAEIPFGEDGDFSEDALKARINGELLADLGNLLNRVLTIAEKHKGEISGKDELSQKSDFKKIQEYMNKLELHHALNEVWNFIRSVNKYVNEKEPWKLQGKELGNVLYNLLESLRIISILISPFIPETSDKINKQLGVKAGTFKDLTFRKWDSHPKKGEFLFEKVK